VIPSTVAATKIRRAAVSITAPNVTQKPRRGSYSVASMPVMPIGNTTRSQCAVSAFRKIGLRAIWLAVPLLAVLGLAACGSDAKKLTSAELRDPNVCASCHPTQVADWSRSMHAYASDDPVFIAMNQRGQRETNGALGNFCVKCHAPVAVHDGTTTDGLNLATLPPAQHGVTCFFCHSAESVEGTHNNPLTLATDGRMVGPISDPASGAPHPSAYSALLDGYQRESAGACGTCHDIVNTNNVALERTYQEWQSTVFAIPPHGQSCGQCHMATSHGPASTVSTVSRTLHAHDFPAVDLQLSGFPGADPAALRKASQMMLDNTIQTTICVDDAARKILVALDNVAAGHSWPSGASQDRRAWVDVTAYSGADVIYKSGVANGETPEAAADPDLWMVRDCIFDDTQNEAHMFWQATSQTTNLISGSITAVLSDPTSFTRSHQKMVYPVSMPLTTSPDRIDVQVFLKAIGDDVLASLVQSNDLDPAVASAVPTYQLQGAATVEWTRAKSKVYLDIASGDSLACVVPATYTAMGTIAAATSHARCTP
jgi:hypothetical protein